MNENKVTVVLPIYNVEKYLDRCINSVINQTFKNLEIILVNDGSTDNCLKICEKYKNIDDRIIIINQRNKGLSAARNSGIIKATSKYICFIDSDDYIEKDMIEYLYNGMKKYNSQITCCGFTNIYENGIKEKITRPKKDFVYTREKALDIHLISGYIDVVAWNKLYDIELFKNVKYPEGLLYEDMLTTYKLIYNANKVVLLPESKYYYCKRSSSIGGANFSEKTLKLIEACDEVYNFTTQKYKRCKFIKLAQVQWYIVVLNKMLISNWNQSEFYKQIKRMIFNILGLIIITKKIKFIRKFQMILIALFPVKIYRKLYLRFIFNRR